MIFKYNKKTEEFLHFDRSNLNIINNPNHFNISMMSVEIKNEHILDYLINYNYTEFKEIKNIYIDKPYCDHYATQLSFFLGKTIYYNYEENKTSSQIEKIMTNPTVNGFYNLKSKHCFKKKEIKYQNDILNEICHIDISRILIENGNVYNFNFIISKIIEVWGYFLSYNIFNLPNDILASDELVIEFYKTMMASLGELCTCHPVNDKTTKFSQSRDIKYIPKSNKFFSSNARQPLHNDYAYYPEEISPDWLLLMSLQQSEYGGITSYINTKKVNEIMEKYNKELLEKVKSCEIIYKYEDIEKGTIVHKKKLFSDDNVTNWNFFQIKDELNSIETMNIRSDFFDFLEKFITDGQVVTLKKEWSRGEAILINDHFNLHQRSSFLGSRWLKDYVIKDIKPLMT